MRLAYLIGHYPGVSLTFILREIKLLRASGISIETASINAPDPSSDGFTEAEREEQRRTFYVKARGVGRIALDHLRCLFSRPLPYLKGLLFAARVGGLDVRTLVYHLFYFAEAVVVGEWMRRQNLTHVHVHFANATAMVALITTRIYPVTYSITVHGPNEFYGVELYRLREKVEGASFLCCIGNFCRSQLMQLSDPSQWPKFHVSPLGVDPEQFTPAGRGSDGTEFNILCVGRLVPAKGQAILLAAAASLVRAGLSVRVHLAGDGPSRPALEALCARLAIQRHVSFHGSVNQDRLRPLLNAAHVFVLPSFAEGIPVALMEAMSMEIPCVSTYIAGIPELIESGVDGMLVPPSDAELLAGAIRRLMEDTALRARIAHAGRQKVIARYNLPVNVQRLRGVLTEELTPANADTVVARNATTLTNA